MVSKDCTSENKVCQQQDEKPLGILPTLLPTSCLEINLLGLKLEMGRLE